MYILTNKQTSYHCIILIDIFVVLSKLLALIKSTVTYDCDVISNFFFFFIFFFFLLFRYFRRNSANFSAKCLFGKVSFLQNGFSAKWFSAKCRASFENTTFLVFSRIAQSSMITKCAAIYT